LNGKKKIFIAFIGTLAFSAVSMSCSASVHRRILGDRRHNQLRASDALKKIRDAQVVYKSEKGSYGSIHDLINSKLVPAEMGNEEYDGYKIKINNKGESYEATAVPLKYKVTGSYSFYLNESGTIRASLNEGKEPNSSDPAIVDR
jgi:hypothetical protein